MNLFSNRLLIDCAGKDQAMNGAESLIKVTLAAGVDTCFANPGTTEMPLVAALDSVPGMRAVYCACSKGSAAGAADRVRADVAQTCDDASASRTRTRQWSREICTARGARIRRS